MPKARQVRVLIPGYTGFGRDVLRGVVRYVRTRHPPWRLSVEMNPFAARGTDWTHDEGTIVAVPDRALVGSLVRAGRPLVNCLAHYERLGVPTVRAHDEATGRLAAEYFLERGFERFVFTAAGDRSRAARLRLQGFREVLSRRGYTVGLPGPPFDAGDDAPVQFDWRDLVAFLGSQAFPQALFCSHDLLGRQACGHLGAGGIAVPEQVAVLGVDNDLLQCEIAEPPLSSVELPYREMGFEAARQLDQLLHGRPARRMPALFEPLGVVTRQSTDIVAVEDERLSEAVRYVREHACDPCTVADIARNVGVSRRVLERLFRRQFGCTPHNQIIRVRMRRACYLLRTTNLPIPALAGSCGYGLVQNFGRAFRHALAQTPAAYRKSHQQEG